VVEQNGDAPFNRGKLFNIGQYFCYFITRISSYIIFNHTSTVW
jgi:hypothetical protein